MVEYSIYHLWRYRLSLLSGWFRIITGAVIIYFRSDYQLSRTSVNDKREKLKKSISHPFLCCWKSADLLMLFCDFLQVMTTILHKWIWELAKIITRKKAWNRRFKPEKSSNNAGNQVTVPVWRPLLYQLSYTPKCSVAAWWASLTCREYDTTDTRFCQAFFNTKTPIWVRTCITACDTHVMRISLYQKSRMTNLNIARHCRRFWPLLDHVFIVEYHTPFFSGCDATG